MNLDDEELKATRKLLTPKSYGKTQEKIRRQKLEMLLELFRCDNMHVLICNSKEKNIYCVLKIYYKTLKLTMKIDYNMIDGIKSQNELIKLENDMVKCIKSKKGI